MKYVFALTAFVVFASTASAAVTPATWSSWTATSATGDLGGITVTASSSAGAPIVGIVAGQFGSQWDGSAPLGPAALGVTVSNVNGGDSQTFSFSSPLLDGTIMYIENFDSSSVAEIDFVGATSYSLIDASPSITFDNIGPGQGSLMTSNAGYNGEGDAAILLNGPVTEITINYSNGVGANGVFYTFAAPDAQAVPEPASALIMAGLFGLGGTVICIRKKRGIK